MGWIGAGLGGLFGSRGGGILGAIIGAVVGNWIENAVKGAAAERRGSAERGELEVLAAIAAMMSKMAKADGRITPDEVRFCESVFTQLGLHGEKREYCIRVFRMAKNDAHSIYEYAESFAEAQAGDGVREIVYDILWNLACVDGVVSPEELEILRRITVPLRISPAQFGWQCSRRGVRGAQGGSDRRPPRARAQEPDAYAILGVRRDASDDALRKAYREKAMALHPDRLRAEGLSEELLGKANEQMAKVNEAWAQIKRERGIR